MIEVIYKEEQAEQDGAQETFAMPRNVRQIGLANGNTGFMWKIMYIHF